MQEGSEELVGLYLFEIVKHASFATTLLYIHVIGIIVK